MSMTAFVLCWCMYSLRLIVCFSSVYVNLVFCLERVCGLGHFEVKPFWRFLLGFVVGAWGTLSIQICFRVTHTFLLRKIRLGLCPISFQFQVHKGQTHSLNRNQNFNNTTVNQQVITDTVRSIWDSYPIAFRFQVQKGQTHSLNSNQNFNNNI